MSAVEDRAATLGHEVAWRQSDHEGDLVGWLLGAAGDGSDAVVINPGALSHYSYALRDADRGLRAPGHRGAHVEHRTPARSSARHSVVSEVCRATIIGLGAGGYHLALEAMPWITDLRRTTLSERLRDLEVDALLVTGLTNVRYLTGFTGSNGQALGHARDERLLHRRPVHRAVAPRGPRSRAGDVHGRLRRRAGGTGCERLGIERLGFEAHAGHGAVRTNGSAPPWAPESSVVCDDEVERIRWTKDDEELDLLRDAQAATDQAFDDILETPGGRRDASDRSPGSSRRCCVATAPTACRSSRSSRSARTPPSRTTSQGTARSRRATSSRWTSERCSAGITPT